MELEIWSYNINNTSDIFEKIHHLKEGEKTLLGQTEPGSLGKGFAAGLFHQDERMESSSFSPASLAVREGWWGI